MCRQSGSNYARGNISCVTSTEQTGLLFIMNLNLTGRDAGSSDCRNTTKIKPPTDNATKKHPEVYLVIIVVLSAVQSPSHLK